MEYASKKNGSNKIYSEQNLIDCVTDNKGCDGGDQAYALMYVMINGIAESSAYKYTQKTRACKSSTIKPVYFLPNMAFLQFTDEETLLLILIRSGPVAVTIRKTNNLLLIIDFKFSN